MSLEIDVREHEWRASLGLGPILRFDLLTALLPISATEWTSAAGLTASAIELVNAEPDYFDVNYEDSGVHVRRAVRPIVHPIGVRIATNHWRQGLEWAGRFAGYAERTLMVSENTSDLEQARLEAMYFGVGLVVQRPNELDEIVSHPAPFMPERFSAASWYFSEQLYGKWMERSS
ncbi:hypothetical protein [Herbiconiux liukaitaii]|uniref:hypothetical protein n=1 Tax=Herbiconiux liukaitaii TaxID=3342799 RepID=UPI0035B91974